MSNKAYDGRKIVHPDHGPVIKIWDFAEQGNKIHKMDHEEERWLCQFANDMSCLYWHSHMTKIWQTPKKITFYIRDSGWGNYINNSNPPIIIPTKKKVCRLVDKGAYYITEYYEVDI